MKFLIVLLCSFTLLPGFASDRESLCADRLNQAARIAEEAEKIRATQPEFADWVRTQQPIHENFARALAYDAVNAPERFESVLADWDYLLRRMRAEVEIFAGQQDLRSGGSLNVRDFGARADGIHDDAPAIRAAIAAALAGETRRVFLPAGRYRVGDDPQQKRTVFHLSGVSNLLIEGEPGTVLVTANLHATAFLLENHCENVQLSTLTVTSEVRPYSTGRIVSAQNPSTLVVAVDEGMPEPTAEFFRESDSGGLLRFYTGELRPDGKTPIGASIAPHSGNPEVKRRPDGLYEFTLSDRTEVATLYQPGMRLALFARNWGNQKISNNFSHHTRFHRIRVESSSSMAFLNQGGEALIMTGCSVGADATTFVCTAADGIYSYNAPLGSYIAGNDIRDVGDDFLNIHSPVRPAYAQEGEKLYFAIGALGERPEDLYRLGVVRTTRNQPFVSEEVKVLSTRRFTRADGVELYEVICDRAIAPVRTQEIEGVEKTPGVDLFVFNHVQNHGTVVTDNDFRHGVSRILPGGRNWVMSHNRIDDNLGWEVLFLVEQSISHMDETFFPRNITFVNNAVWSLYKSDFQIRSAAQDPPATIAHLTIEDNRFTVAPWGENNRSIFEISGTDHLQLSGNNIVSSDAAATSGSWGPWLSIRHDRESIITDNESASVFQK